MAERRNDSRIGRNSQAELVPLYATAPTWEIEGLEGSEAFHETGITGLDKLHVCKRNN